MMVTSGHKGKGGVLAQPKYLKISIYLSSINIFGILYVTMWAFHHHALNRTVRNRIQNLHRKFFYCEKLFFTRKIFKRTFGEQKISTFILDTNRDERKQSNDERLEIKLKTETFANIVIKDCVDALNFSMIKTDLDLLEKESNIVAAITKTF